MKTIDSIPTSKIQRASKLVQTGAKVGVNYIKYYGNKFVSTDETVGDINNIAKKRGYLKKGDMAISLASMPIAEKGMVNTLRVREITK